MEEKFAGGKFREIPCAVDNYFAGGKFRAKSKFANIAKISSTRKIRVIQYTERRLTEPGLTGARLNALAQEPALVYIRFMSIYIGNGLPLFFIPVDKR